MIKLNDLSSGMTLILDDELKSVHGGDGIGAIIGGGAGFSAAGVLSGGNIPTALNGGAAGAGLGNLIPVLNNPVVGVPAAVLFGTAAGIGQALTPSSSAAPVNVPPVGNPAPINQPQSGIPNGINPTIGSSDLGGGLSNFA